jgi:hypothetical protein
MINESELLGSYLKFCELRREAYTRDTLNLSRVDWFYPTTLLPIGVFVKENPGIKEVVPPKDPYVHNYYELIVSGRAIPGGSYVPIVEIPSDKHMRERILEPIYSNIHEVGGINVLTYIVGEPVDNVYQHSQFSTAYIMAQKYPTKKFTEISILDNGVSIPGAFEHARIDFSDDADALSKAIKGVSTKKQDDERGYGLSSTVKLVTEGLKGEALIVSRKSGFVANEKEKTLYRMGKLYMFKGTLISFRVPFQNREVNIYDYIDV